MKGSILQIKKYLFLFLTILTTSSIVATVIIYFCIFEKSKEFRKNIGEIGESVIVFNNSFYMKKDPYKKEFFMDYEDMLEIIRRCNNVSGAILTYSVVQGGSIDSENIILLRNKKESQAISEGVSADYDKLMGLTIKEGRFLKKGDEESEVCVIFENLAKELDAKVLDTVKYMGKELKIIGIIADQRPFDINMVGLGGIYLPIKIKRQLYENEVTYPKEMLLMKSEERIPLIKSYLIYVPEKKELVYQELTNLLENKYGKGNEFYLGEDHTSLLALKFEKIIWTVGLLFICSSFLLLNKKVYLHFYY